MFTMARSGRHRESKGQRRRREKEAEGARRRAVTFPDTPVYSPSEWQDENGAIGRYVCEQRIRTLNSYKVNPPLIMQDANQEYDLERGGYATRQVIELVQNATDATFDSQGGRIHLRLTNSYFYCADDGEVIDEKGAKALLFSHLSPKRGTNTIGRFGLGFKSVLAVTDSPNFLSRSGSFEWNRQRAESEIRKIAPDTDNCPTLRIAYALNPSAEANSDPVLLDLMSWATNIIRLPLKDDAVKRLQKQLADFPSQFPLFVPHVSTIEIVDDLNGASRRITCNRDDGYATLSDGESESRWLLASNVHPLSTQAKADTRTLDEADEVRITWAAPIDRLNEPGQFWAYFPTLTQSLLSGILNAPWKTNEDRQNLLPGPYNDELIEAAAQLVAEVLHKLCTEDDPSRHLISLPRRSEDARDNEHAEFLSREIYRAASVLAVVPDQHGKLREIDDIRYSPSELFSDGNLAPNAFDRWQAFDGRPTDWLHHSALNRNKIPKLRLIWGTLHEHPNQRGHLPEETITEWLEALVKRAKSSSSVTIEAIRASQAAIQTAALIPSGIRGGKRLGEIVLTADGRWVEPNTNSVFLGGSHADATDSIVHADLENDPETIEALVALGIRPASGAAVFEQMAKDMLQPSSYSRPYASRDWHDFWVLAKKIETDTAAAIIRNSSDQWRDVLHVKTMTGEWRTLHEALLPGPVVPGDGSRDDTVAIDLVADDSREGYHSKNDERLLRALGATDRPSDGFPMPADQYARFEQSSKDQFSRWASLATGSTPQAAWLMFVQGFGISVGPLGALEKLSEEGRAAFTTLLLGINNALKPWRIEHSTRDYGHRDFNAPIIPLLQRYGRIETIGGIFPLADGLGDPPANSAVRERLLGHPNAEAICEAFGIPETLTAQEPDDDIDNEIDDEADDDESDFDDPAGDVETVRDAIRRESEGDAERLLRAVGRRALRQGLPPGLLELIKHEKGEPLDDREVAEAAISTFDKGALEEYKGALDHLDPPRRWAGGPQAVAFAQSLGFSEAWAGSRSNRRDAFLEVDGPFSLPPLHDFQRRVVDNVRQLLTVSGDTPDRRGMISMPTGSGKTRVAVQAIVESIRGDGISSGVLWVADRDELCEQAVQAWREVWASEGTPEKPLRISRLWQGQQDPLPVTEFHVVIASIQTLNARVRQGPYNFLADFDIVVFDEAHRSIAPTSTGVMQELGLTQWRRSGEPILIGLTATPYRGRDTDETRRLVNRYSANRLDEGAFDSNEPKEVVRELQELSVLAAADHETITGGRFELTDEELRELRTFSRLPERAEQRIGRDGDRTRRILDAYRQHIDPRWPTLVFATSVEHSKIVAAMLNREGVAARAVWGETKASVRRGIVEDFRTGRIQALVNYGVFREGFDAPKTRAIVVARPVYSPNLYFQMIGRGLRGVRNGGNDRCLILNVEDNIDNYEGQLAFSELDWLWDES